MSPGGHKSPASLTPFHHINRQYILLQQEVGKHQSTVLTFFLSLDFSDEDLSDPSRNRKVNPNAIGKLP